MSPKLQLRISTPTEPTAPGRGFYQLEEDALYVQVGPFIPDRAFYSYLESDTVRFDLDRHGRLIFVEVTVPRRQWPVTDELILPPRVEPASIRWLDFRNTIPSPVLLTDRRRTRLLLRFLDTPPVRTLHAADSVFLQVDSDSNLTSVWICDIIDDLAGQEIAAYRKALRKQFGQPEPAGERDRQSL